MDNKSIALAFAQKHGYKTAVRENNKKWKFVNKSPIFTPVFDGDEVRFTGLPQFIIVENGIPRFLIPDEIEKIVGIHSNDKSLFITEDKILTS